MDFRMVKEKQNRKRVPYCIKNDRKARGGR